MVKLLSFGLFDGQNLLPSSGNTEDEPVDIIAALNDCLVATRGGEILHYNIGTNDCTVLNRFETQNNQIQAIHYIPCNDGILALEKDCEKSSINVIRIYQNWRQNQSSLVLEGGGGAGSGGSGGGASPLGSSPGALNPQFSIGSSSYVNSSYLNVYKVPVPSTIVAVGTCPITSRIIVSTQSSVSVWGPIYNVLSSTLINYFEKILDISIEGVTRVSIYESFISYATETDVKVLSLNLTLQEEAGNPNDKPQNSSSKNNVFFSSTNSAIGSNVNNGPSEIVEDESYFEVSFDLYGQPTGRNQLGDLYEQQNPARKQSMNDVLGPISDIENGININQESGYTLQSSTLLLSKKMEDDNIHTIFFLPDSTWKDQPLDLESASVTESPQLAGNGTTKSFLNLNTNSSSSPQKSKMLKLSQSRNSSNKSQSTTSPVRFMVSTSKNGYLYNISKPNLLASYQYANETVVCSASYSFLYTITTEGLETWSLRSCEGSDDGDNIPSPMGLNKKIFLYCQKIAVVGDYLIILSKLNQEQLAKSQKQPLGKGVPTIMRSPNPKKPTAEFRGLAMGPSGAFWSTYILHHTPLQSLYKEILNETMSTKEKDEEVYHTLLLEGHFLLQSKLANQHRSNPKMNDMASILNFGVERKIYQSLLKRSASLLGEYFFTKQKDYMRAAQWFSSSDSDIETIFNLLKENQQSHQSLIYYLEHVLYDPQSYEILLNKEELCNKILEHYHVNSPHRLPSLILESSISSYSQILAIELLKKISEECDFDLVDRNQIYFALGLLYLDQNSIENAISSFNQIPTESLISLCLKNPKILAPSGESTPTALCKILRQSTPWGLLDITIQLVNLHEITPDFGLTILLFSTTTFTNGILNPIYHHNDYDLDALLLKIYLEWFLSIYTNNNNLNNNFKTNFNQSTNNSQSSIIQNYTNELISIFLKYLIQLYVQDIHRFSGEDYKLFQSLKLDVPKILNINSSSSLNQSKGGNSKKDQLQLVQNQVIDEYCQQWMIMHLNTFLTIPQWLSKLPPFEINNPSAKDEIKSLLSPLYYKKLQSLLSVNKIKDFEFMDTVEFIFQDNNDNIMFLSLKLACLPMLGQVQEGIELAVETNIQIILDYSLHFCKSEEDWAIVLNTVLSKYQSTTSSSEKEIIIREYEKILDHLTSFLDPEAFLHLLPSTGKMDYFMNFIEKSFSNYQSKLLKASLSYQLIEMENDTM